jgi:hypothetical protein
MGSPKPGNPLDPSTTHGPQADEIQFKRVSEYLKLARDGKDKGKVELGGNTIKMEGDKGFFIEPTIITGQEENARLMKEEIFGPVVGINVFKTEKEAIEKAIDSEFGSFFLTFLSRVVLIMNRLVLCRLFQEHQPGTQSRKSVSRHRYVFGSGNMLTVDCQYPVWKQVPSVSTAQAPQSRTTNLSVATRYVPRDSPSRSMTLLNSPRARDKDVRGSVTVWKTT